MNDAEKHRRALEAVIAISVEALADPVPASQELAEDDGNGPGADLTAEEVEHIAITMFGCPAPDERDEVRD